MVGDSNGYDVALSFVGMVSALLVVLVPFWLTSRRAKRRQLQIQDAVGVQNGNGNLIQMHERTLGIVTEIVGWQQTHDVRDEERFGSIARRLDKLERPDG